MIRTAEEWQKIFEDQKASGMSIGEYCKSHQISRASFYKNKRKLTEPEEPFQKVDVVEDVSQTIVEFKIDDHTISCDPRYLELIVSALL